MHRKHVSGRSLRVALYSHDTQGLGHIRRNIAIAAALSQAIPDASILLISGTPLAGSLELPPGVDCVTLPALAKHGQGRYAARSLNVSLAAIIALRSRLLLGALQAFAPDVFIVDKVARGALGELEPALTMLRQQGRTRCILGLRDILDAPSVTRREWRQSRSDEAVAAYYDAVWVYGDPRVYDAATVYGFPAHVVDKLRYTGYLNRFHVEPPVDGGEPECSGQPMVFCQVGGGQDGFQLAQAFVRARLPRGARGVLLTGPFMPAEQRNMLHALAADRSGMSVLDFSPHPERLLVQAERVIAMGGYNTTCEILASGRSALLVPRVRPRLEQWLRAEQLQRLGLVDALHPDALSPEALSAWLSHPDRAAAQVQVDLDGLKRLPGMLEEVLGAPHPRSLPAPEPVLVSATKSNHLPEDLHVSVPIPARGLPAQNVSALL